MARSTNHNSWEGVERLAEKAGAKYPELVAAQWALESGWGKQAPGNNFFGLKGPGQLLDTTEFENGKEVEVADQFLQFEGIEECVNYLVTRWYKDWKDYKGVNRNSTREGAARQLQKEGYATNPNYANKLIELMQAHAGGTQKTEKDSQPVLFRLKAKQATALKKEPKQVTELGEKETVQVAPGRIYEVLLLKELAADAHDWVKLGHGAGNWFIWGPHWERVLPVANPPEGGVPTTVNWADFTCPVTKNLTVGEVLQWDKRRAPASGSSVERRILATVREFQKIRDAWGQSLEVTSFYRPEPINQQVGGVPGSRHVSGEAFDIYPSKGDLNRFYQWVRVRWTGGLGDGRSRGFVHLDTRNGGHFVPGAGARPAAEWDY
jgi:hypothetical protein